MQDQLTVPKIFLDLLNQVFEIEKKTSSLQESNSIQRNVNKLKELFENEFGLQLLKKSSGFTFHSPLGEEYDFTRTDCEASIAGSNTENLIITEVIKPIIRYREGGRVIIVQKAIVVAESKQIDK